MKKLRGLYILIIVLIFSCSCSNNQQYTDLKKGFIEPPRAARPYVWWHWINGNISEDGITRDLEAMSSAGLGGATIFNLGQQAEPGPVIYGSCDWQKLVDHAFTEADRLGLELSFQNCGGWATSGGPWVTPDNAMKKLTYKMIHVKGPVNYSDILPVPANINEYYKDVRVLAFPDNGPGLGDKVKYTLKNISCDHEIINPDAIIDGDLLTELWMAEKHRLFLNSVMHLRCHQFFLERPGLPGKEWIILNYLFQTIMKIMRRFMEVMCRIIISLLNLIRQKRFF